MRFAFEPGTAARITNRFSRPLAAVCHRYDFDLRIGKNIAQSFRDVFSNLPRVERAFEFIRGNKDFHRSTGILPVGPAGVSPAGSHALGS